MSELTYNCLRKDTIVNFSLLLLTIAFFFVSPNVFADIITTEQGALVKTNPILSDTGMDYSTNNNGVRLEVFGYAVEPEFDGDPNYDYFLFKIHGTVDAGLDWAPNNSGLKDPNGPTMEINVDALGNAIILTGEVEPGNKVNERRATTVSFQIEASDPLGTVTAGLGVSYEVPRWEADTSTLTDTEIDWIAASNTDHLLALGQEYAWAFSFATSVPQGTGSVILDITIVGNFWQNFGRARYLDNHSTGVQQTFLMPDIDGDGYVDQNYNGNDCNDNDADINPDASETCNDTDDDCDGSIDNDLTRETNCGEGECAGNTGTETCTAGIWDGNTCDPYTEATVEICDNLDNDCNGSIDDGLNCVCYDGETRVSSCGEGDCADNEGTETCVDGNWANNTCDPYYGATTEVCDNSDNDCDGSIDNGLNCVCYDGETRVSSCGVGDCAGNEGTETCVDGNWSGNTCDPYNGAINEVCDNKDNDCDGSVDEDYTINTYYYDADGDGYGDPNDSLVTCSQPINFVANNEDNCPDDPNKNEPGSCGCGSTEDEGPCDQTPASSAVDNTEDNADDVDNYSCFIRTLL